MSREDIDLSLTQDKNEQVLFGPLYYAKNNNWDTHADCILVVTTYSHRSMPARHHTLPKALIDGVFKTISPSIVEWPAGTALTGQQMSQIKTVLSRQDFTQSAILLRIPRLMADHMQLSHLIVERAVT